jgi:hypothetical protein
MTMGLFSSSKSWTASAKHSHIDPSTGRNKRDKSPVRGSGAPRRNGKVVDRAEWRRSQRTGRPMQRKSWGW